MMYIKPQDRTFKKIRRIFQGKRFYCSALSLLNGYIIKVIKIHSVTYGGFGCIFKFNKDGEEIVSRAFFFFFELDKPEVPISVQS